MLKIMTWRPGKVPLLAGVLALCMAGYIAAYRLRLIIVLVCMLCNTLSSLAGSYLLRDIINALDRSADLNKNFLLKIIMPDAVEAGTYLIAAALTSMTFMGFTGMAENMFG